MRPKKHIILIDQNEMRQSILRFLFTNKGWAVLSAATAEAAKENFLSCELVIAGWPCALDVGAVARYHYQVPSLVVADREDPELRKLNVDRTLISAAPWEIFEVACVLGQRKRGPKPALATLLKREAQSA